MVRNSDEKLSTSRLIVGLGNPGREYEYTRHNLGFLAVRSLAQKCDLKFQSKSSLNGMIAEGKVDNHRLWVLMPLTFVNNSGEAVSKMIHYHKIDLNDVLIVCDDVAVDFGQLRLRVKGSHGGHNGLRSIIEHLGSGDFSRLRLGVGKPSAKEDMVNFVLGEFNKTQKAQLNDFIEEATQCCLMWLNDGITKAMEQFNRRKGNGKNGSLT